MKNTYTIAQRNALVEKYLPCIDTVMHRHRRLIREARLDREDVYQQLALRLIKAVEDFDPDKEGINFHIDAELRDEMIECADAYRRFGVTDAPSDISARIVSLEAYLDTKECGLPVAA